MAETPTTMVATDAPRSEKRVRLSAERAKRRSPRRNRSKRKSSRKRDKGLWGKQIRDSYIVILQPTFKPEDLLSSVLKGWTPTFTYGTIFIGFAVDRVPIEKLAEIWLDPRVLKVVENRKILGLDQQMLVDTLQTGYTVVNRDTGELYDVRELDGTAPYRYSILPSNLRVPRKARDILGINHKKTRVHSKAARVMGHRRARSRSVAQLPPVEEELSKADSSSAAEEKDSASEARPATAKRATRVSIGVRLVRRVVSMGDVRTAPAGGRVAATVRQEPAARRRRHTLGITSVAWERPKPRPTPSKPKVDAGEHSASWVSPLSPLSPNTEPASSVPVTPEPAEPETLTRARRDSDDSLYEYSDDDAVVIGDLDDEALARKIAELPPPPPAQGRTSRKRPATQLPANPPMPPARVIAKKASEKKMATRSSHGSGLSRLADFFIRTNRGPMGA